MYVGATDAHEVTVVPAPLPPVQFGAYSVAVAEAAAGRTPVVRALLPIALGTTVTKGIAALVGDASRTRVAALRLRRAFQVGDELDRLKVLHFRARYQDGLVATLNDVVFARRNIPEDAAADGLAKQTRGTEWESIFVPVGELLHRGENVLTVEVRPSAARLVPQVEVELSGSESARVVRGPILGRVGQTHATVVFETDVPTLGEVRLEARTIASSDEPATRHVVEVDGLEPGTQVTYQIAVSDGGVTETSAPLTFHTAPADGEPVRFVVYGDVRSGHDVHAEVLRAVDAEAPDFVMATGDMVNRGTDEGDWQKFFSVAGALLSHTAFYPAMGNHDQGAISGSERRFEDVFALPARPADCPPGAAWYSFDVQGVHVAVLDSNRYSDDKQLAWLDADLVRARASGARALFAIVHHGPYARGPHGGDSMAVARYVPVLVKRGVAVLFSGHDHIYQRGKMDGLTYVVTGGAGASPYPITCGVSGRPRCKTEDGAVTAMSAYHYVLVEVLRDDLRMCAKRPDGSLLEACVVLKLPR